MTSRVSFANKVHLTVILCGGILSKMMNQSSATEHKIFFHLITNFLLSKSHGITSLAVWWL